jgi:hypothetical protein
MKDINTHKPWELQIVWWQICLCPSGDVKGHTG